MPNQKKKKKPSSSLSMSLSPSELSPQQQPKPAPASSKRSKKSRAASEKYFAAGNHKLALLRSKTLKLVPFTLPFTFSRHEALFRSLGLWDFVKTDLERSLNEDFVTQLVAFYDAGGRKSTVNGFRISVSRADLARALGLPVKKRAGEEVAGEGFGSEEIGSVLEEFISSYLLFHLQEDDDNACILPQEVLAATQLVKDGQAGKVDWAGLIWGFVEKELQEVFKTGVCYYASHLQQLIRHQQPKLFEPVPAEPEPETVPSESGTDNSMEEEEKQEDEADKEEQEEEHEEEETEQVEELMDVGQNETGQLETGLNLGLGSENEGFSKECDDEVNWGLMQEKHETGLRACGSSGLGTMEFENLDPKPDMSIRDEDFKEEGEDDHIMHSFERLNSSTDLLQAMENVNNVNNMNQFDNDGLDPHMNIDSLDSGNFLSISRENHTHNNAGSFYFANNGKRPLSEINEDDDEDDEDDEDDDGVHLHAKRMRNDIGNCSFDNNTGNNQGQSDFFAVIEKAKMQYMEKEQALMNSQMEVQYASGLIQQKDQMIQQLENARVEDQHRYRSELCRYEQEMNVMAQVISGYKKALKKTRVLFSDYRKKFPDPDEKPYYVDVPNGGGLMVSRKEMERIKMEREIEMKEIASNLVGDFEREWIQRFEGYGARLEKVERKVRVVEGEIPRKEREVGGEGMVVEEVGVVNEGNENEGIRNEGIEHEGNVNEGIEHEGNVNEGIENEKNRDQGKVNEGNVIEENRNEGNGDVVVVNDGNENEGNEKDSMEVEDNNGEESMEVGEENGENKEGEGKREVEGVNEGGEGKRDEVMEVEKTTLPLDQ